MLFVSATLLRVNNLGMVERRDAVIEADATGDKVATQQSLQQLREYVNTHMNSSLGDGVYLETAYNAARDAALEQATSPTNPNSAVYQQASVECRARFQGGADSFRNDYVLCVVERVSALSQSGDPIQAAQLPQPDTYRYNFVSPVWTPDAAGFSVLVSLLIAMLILGRTIVYLLAKLFMHRRYRSIYS